MDRKTFTNTLNTAMQQKILAGLNVLVEQRVDYYRQLIRLLSALDEKDDEHILEEGLGSILSNISKQLEERKNTNLSEFYLLALHEVAAEFPAEVIWQQKEVRFTPANTDSWMLSVQKRGKKTVRFLSHQWLSLRQSSENMQINPADKRKTWNQKIPAQRLIKYHLADSEFVADAIHQLEDLQLQLLVKVESLLIAQSQTKDQEHPFFDLSPLIQWLQQETDTLGDQIRKKLIYGVDELKSEIRSQVERTGTIERKEGYYDKARIDLQLKNTRQALLKLEDQWEETQRLLVERGKNILEFLRLKEDIREQRAEFLQDFEQQFHAYMLDPFWELRQLLEDSISDITKGGRKDSYEQIEKTKKQLLAYIYNHLEEPLQQLQEQNILSGKAENFAETLLMRMNQTPEKLFFIFDLNTQKRPPAVNKKQIEWRLLLVRALREQMNNGLKPSEQHYSNFIADVIDKTEEIENILQINLESALQGFTDEELRANEEQNPPQVATEALERVIEKVDGILPAIQERCNDIEKAVIEGEHQFFDLVINLLDTIDAKELQLFLTKYKVKETTQDWQEAVDTRTHRSKKKLGLWFRFARKKTFKYVNKVKIFFGYAQDKPIESKRADIASYLSETDQKLKELPYIYRRLFNFDEMANRRFYVPVTESAATFKKAYEQWEASFAATFAVVGEKGSGKSTFLQLMIEELPNNVEPVSLTIKNTISTEERLIDIISTELNLEAQHSTEKMIEMLRQGDQRRVVIIESIQNCFVRNINGYEAIEKLCYLISETKDQVFWVVSCSRYGWHFLDKTQSLSEYFSHIVRTDMLDMGDLEKLILNRHRSSGYTLHFDAKPDAIQIPKSKEVTDAEVQQDLRKEYFEKLTAFADGNASTAMIFWIRSIRKFDDNCLYIKPLEITSLEMIQDLNPQILFTLAAFVLHDTISDQDLSNILNLNKEESRLLLVRLRSRGLLLHNEHHYLLNHLMYRQIVRVLKDRNIIHLG